jgi:integrase
VYDYKRHGKTYKTHVVTGTAPDGTKVKKGFSNRDRALQWKSLKEIEMLNGNQLHTVVTRLDEGQIRDAESVLNRLGSVPLTKAIDYFLANYRPVNEEIDLEDAIEIFYWEKKKQIRPRTLIQLDSSMRHFRDFIGASVKVSQIATPRCEEFLRSRGPSPKTWNNYRADIHSFFEFARDLRRLWIGDNPVSRIVKHKVERGMPEVLSAEQCRKLMLQAESYKDGKMVPYFALCLFAGIRPAGEAVALAKRPDRGQLIDLENKVIHILPEFAKTGQYRQVKIQPALDAFLRAYPGPILCKNFEREVKAVRSCLKLSHDVLRHTFYSMHIAAFKSVGEAAIEGGSGESIVKRHYLNLKSLSEAKEFWAIIPVLRCGQLEG